MSGAEGMAVGGVLMVLFLGMPLIRMIAKRFSASPEVARKMIHVAMGLTCAGFPWIFQRSTPVWVLAGIATVPLILIRVFPKLRTGIGSPLHSIARPSFGEVLFAPAVATVFALAAGDLYLYLIPILILTIADAAGAIFGTRWGTRRYGSGEGFKTVEGSMIFWFTAFLCVCLPLMIGGRVDPLHALSIGVILGILAMMAEGISDRGFDNMVLPVGCFFMLQKLLPLEMSGLVGRAVVLGLLLALVLLGARWSTLSGGALLGSVLLGYGCAVMADWRFALPPVAVFVSHLVTTRKHRLTDKFDHRLDAVLSHTIAAMPWVIAAELGWTSVTVALAGVSFAMGAQLAILDTATRTWMPDLLVTPVRSAFKGLLVASVPGLVFITPEFLKWAGPMGVAVICMWLVAVLFNRIQPCYHGHVTGLWIIKGALALAASGPALLIQR